MELLLLAMLGQECTVPEVPKQYFPLCKDITRKYVKKTLTFIQDAIG